MEFVYIVQGFGELAQAESFALYAKEHENENLFITDDEEIQKAIHQTGFAAHISKTPRQAQRLIEELKKRNRISA